MRHTPLRAVRSFALFATLALASTPAVAQHAGAHHGDAKPNDLARLGTLSFPNSGAPAAQGDFVRGVLFLHSFEYDSAAAAFRRAQTADPDFALAYWGEAMTYTHPIWDDQDLPAARAVLTRLAPTAAARAVKARTDRERAWMHTVEVLYGDGSKARRDTLHADAFAELLKAYPDDEAQSFYALTLMGLSRGVRNVPTYVRAGALALQVLERNPDHPGAAHYVIHAFDDPVHAVLGLPAARAYSQIAPGAAHAQHMTTHIFLAMGMWPETIRQNEIASGPDRARWPAGHYTYWLHYGLLQAGRTDDAIALLNELHANGRARGAPPRHNLHLLLARAQQIINAERWDDPALAWEIPMAGVSPIARSVDAFARAYAAVQRGELTRAREIAATLERGTDIQKVLGTQLDAVLARASGNKAEAERLLREAAATLAALPIEFGPPDVVKPPMELLGEWLLADGRTAEAAQAFDDAERQQPGRWLVRQRR